MKRLTPGDRMAEERSLTEKLDEVLSERILEKVLFAELDWTPAFLVKTLSRETGKSSRKIRDEIRRLVEDGRLAYVVNHGRTCIRRAWQRPFFVGEKTQILSPGVPPEPGGRVGIVLLQGVSFGGGDHPTTRLCIEAIEQFAHVGGKMLDVGTGSGVLAIAALRHGMKSALGVDTDPLSLFEAAENVSLNGLDAKINIRQEWVASPEWDFVAANLRPPTLVSLARALCACLTAKGILVLSGMRADEMDLVTGVYTKDLAEVTRKTEKGWGSCVFRKKT